MLVLLGFFSLVSCLLDDVVVVYLFGCLFGVGVCFLWVLWPVWRCVLVVFVVLVVLDLLLWWLLLCNCICLFGYLVCCVLLCDWWFTACVWGGGGYL